MHSLLWPLQTCRSMFMSPSWMGGRRGAGRGVMVYGEEKRVVVFIDWGAERAGDRFTNEVCSVCIGIPSLTPSLPLPPSPPTFPHRVLWVLPRIQINRPHARVQPASSLLLKDFEAHAHLVSPVPSEEPSPAPRHRHPMSPQDFMLRQVRHIPQARPTLLFFSPIHQQERHRPLAYVGPKHISPGHVLPAPSH